MNGEPLKISADLNSYTNLCKNILSNIDSTFFNLFFSVTFYIRVKSDGIKAWWVFFLSSINRFNHYVNIHCAFEYCVTKLEVLGMKIPNLCLKNHPSKLLTSSKREIIRLFSYWNASSADFLLDWNFGEWHFECSRDIFCLMCEHLDKSVFWKIRHVVARAFNTQCKKNEVSDRFFKTGYLYLLHRKMKATRSREKSLNVETTQEGLTLSDGRMQQ